MFFVGHSHVTPLFRAAEAHELSIRRLNLWLFGRPVLYDAASPRLAPELEAMAGEVVVSAVGGSAHDVLGLARHPRPFDFVLPSAPDLPVAPEAELVPAAALATTLRNNIEDEILDLVRLMALSGRRVIHVEPPPPVGDDPRILPDMELLAFVPSPNPGPSPPWLRYKLWRMHSEIIREAYEPAGVEFLAAPSAAQTDEGFLRPEFYDYPCHANRAYGALVLRQLGLIA